MPFKPGESGNPLGRPRGARDRKNVVAAEFAKEGSAIARVVIDKAKDGCMNAAGLVLQRLSPPLRPAAEKVVFPFDPKATVGEQAQSVMESVAAGRVDPDTGRLLLDMLAAVSGLRDIDSFLGELKALRASNKRIAGSVVTT